MSTSDHAATGERRSVLGVVRSHGEQFLAVEPLYIEHNGDWVTITDGKAQFPDRGFVFWWHPPTSAAKGTLWRFEVELHPAYDPPGKPEKYRVAAGALSPVVAVGIDGSASSLRRQLGGVGALLRTAPPAAVLLRIPGTLSEWIGPLDFRIEERSREGVRLVFDVPTGFADVRHLSLDDLQDVRIGTTAWSVLRPNVALPGPTGSFCAQSDHDLLHGLLGRVRKFDRAAVEALGVTKALWDSYLAALGGAQLIDATRMTEDARREALALLDDELVIEGEFLKLAVESILDHPQLQACREEVLREEVRRRLPEVEAQVKAELAKQTGELDSLHGRIEASRATLRQLAARAEQMRGDHEQALASGTAKLDALKRKAEEIGRSVNRNVAIALAEDVIGASFLRGLTSNQGAPANDPIPALLEGDPASMRTLEQVTELVGACARAYRVDAVVLQAAIGFACASRVVVVAGSRSRRLAAAVASLLSGTYAAMVSMSAAVFSGGDVLGLPASPVVASSWSPLSLGQYLLASEAARSLRCVVLLAANRAPLEAYLEELCLGLGPGESGALAWTDADGKVWSAPLAPAVRLILTLQDGAASFTLPPDLRSRLPVVLADRAEGAAPASVQATRSELSRVPLALPSIVGSEDELASALPFPLQVLDGGPVDDQQLLREWSALVRVGFPNADALAEVLASRSVGQRSDLRGPTHNHEVSSLIAEITNCAAARRFANMIQEP